MTSRGGNNKKRTGLDLIREKFGPRPEDPHSEAGKAYREAIKSFYANSRVLGGYGPLDLDHMFVEEGAKFAVEEYNKRKKKGRALELKRVIDARLRGLDIKLALECSDGKFYVTDIMRWCPPGYKFVSFTPTDDTELPYGFES